MKTDRPNFLVTVGALLALGLSFVARAEERVERFPAPDFRSGHKLPTLTPPGTQSPWMEVLDVALLAGFLGVASWLVIKKRSRRWTFFLTILAVAYFGFYRKGCVCPVGATQNVALAAGGVGGYVLPWTIAATFILPLLFSLFYGRVFCSGVCPLGAAQDLVLFKPVHVPAWLESGLGLLAWAYLGLAVLFAATGSDFFICRYDPFVGFFRRSGPSYMLVAGGIILALGLFVGRPYCRFLCPYGVLLRILSPFSRRQVTITPTDCIDCRLCETSCPFGAIRYPSPKESRHALRAEKRRIVWTLALVPLLMGSFALLGYLARGALARMDFTVQLAEKVRAEEVAEKRNTTDETKAFRGTGVPVTQLYAHAARIQSRFGIGSALFGAWMGLAIGGRVVGLLVRQRRSGYTADPAACVACARCYSSCPVEIEVKAKRAAEDLVTV